MEHSDLSGSCVLAQSGKDAEVELAAGPDGLVALTVQLKGKPVRWGGRCLLGGQALPSAEWARCVRSQPSRELYAECWLELQPLACPGLGAAASPARHRPAPPRPCAQLTLPVLPPVVLYGNRVAEGHLGVKFMRVKLKPWDTASKCMQASPLCTHLLPAPPCAAPKPALPQTVPGH